MAPADILLGIDQGTTGTRVVAYDRALAPVAEAYRRTPVSHPRPGWIEKDADAVVRAVEDAVGEVVAAVGGGGRIAAVGLDNEGETVVAWDAETLQPLAPAVVWGCRRSQPVVDRLAAQGAEARIRAVSGLPLDPYFSSSKLRFLLEEEPAVSAAARDGSLRVGTLDAYVTARLGDGARTDASTASRTQLQALRRPGRWDPELLGAFGIDAAWLPAICESTGDLGTLSALPLRAMLVDQTAALAGHGCLAPGATKATYGTGIFILANAGTTAPTPEGLLPVVAWTIEGVTTYAVDGGVFSAGTVIDWLRDGIALIDEPAETEALARGVEDSGGVRFLPALAGLGAPWWRSEARAVWAGITAGTTRGHLVRAVLDALAFRVGDVLDAMAPVAGRPATLRVDGGLTANGYLLERQAAVLGLPVVVARETESTALGAAAMAGVGAGLLALSDIPALVGSGRRVEPGAGVDARERAGWRAFVEAAAALGGYQDVS